MSFSNVKGGARKLNTGYEMPYVGLGIAQIDGADAVEIAVRAALESGYRAFDTAQLYGNEAELGAALKKLLPEFGLTRADVFITTKVPVKNDEPQDVATRRIVGEALKKLQVEYIDLVLVHYPRDRVLGKDDDPVNKPNRIATYATLLKLQDEGLIRSVGVSSFLIPHLDQLAEAGLKTPAVNQCEFQPYFTRNQLRQYCHEKGILFEAFSSLCWGNQEVLNEPAVQKLVEKYNTTPQTVLYAFALNATPEKVAIIPRCDKPAYAAVNIKSADLVFSADEYKQLEALNRDKIFCPGCECLDVV